MNVGSLFSGVGGFDLGLERAGHAGDSGPVGDEDAPAPLVSLALPGDGG